jgi:Rps23 Pro-64 3,4-dihydroxylase Tpa1-like proline 4-hydroxylase
LSIRDFLTPDSAAALEQHLAERQDWLLVLNAGEKVYEMPLAAYAALDPDAKAKMDAMVADAAREGFQFRFASIRVPDADADRAQSGQVLDDFARFLSSPEMVDWFRQITAAPDIAFADAQATCYRPGDFLTRHDDGIEGKNRRAAYVFGLTRDWPAEWGGLLMFHAPSGDIDAAMTPAFNCLRLFAVPTPHSVSPVWPHAPRNRLSVTEIGRAHV